MATVRCFSGTYLSGQQLTLNEGAHQNHWGHGPRSMIVEPGATCVIYSGQSIGDDYTITFYEGQYDDMGFYQVSAPWGWVTIDVKATDVDKDTLATLKWKTYPDNYPMFVKIPLGKENIPDSSGKVNKIYPGVNATDVSIPANTHITLYGKTGESGDSLPLDPPGGGIQGLSAHSYNFTADEWKLISTQADTDNITQDDSDEPPRVVSSNVKNNSDFEVDMEVECSDEFSTDMTSSWDVSAETTIGVSVSEEAVFADFEESVEVSIGGSYGQETTDGQSVSLGATGTVQVPPNSEATMSMITNVGSMTIPTTLIYENQRTGAQETIQGSITTKFAASNEFDVSGGQLSKVVKTPPPVEG